MVRTSCRFQSCELFVPCEQQCQVAVNDFIMQPNHGLQSCQGVLCDRGLVRSVDVSVWGSSVQLRFSQLCLELGQGKKGEVGGGG